MAAQRKKRGKRGLYNKGLTPGEAVARREAAFAAIRRLYREVLPLWRSCPRGHCRRHLRCCSDDPRACLKRGWPLMPPALQKLAFDQVVAGGPWRVHIGIVTRAKLAAQTHGDHACSISVCLIESRPSASLPSRFC